MTRRDVVIAIVAASIGSLIGVSVNWLVVKGYVYRITEQHESCVTALGRQERDMRALWRSMDSPFVSPKYAPKAKRS